MYRILCEECENRDQLRGHNLSEARTALTAFTAFTNATAIALKVMATAITVMAMATMPPLLLVVSCHYGRNGLASA